MLKKFMKFVDLEQLKRYLLLKVFLFLEIIKKTMNFMKLSVYWFFIADNLKNSCSIFQNS